MKVLRTQNIAYSYDNEITFHYPEINCYSNEELLIIGESGKGKTTLLHLLGLILPIQVGKIEINGQSISNLPAKESTQFRAENIGIIFQHHHFIKSLNVIDNLLLANYYAKSILNSQLANDLASRLGIEKILAKPIFELSGGELQRVGIARALMNKPGLILADEPTSNLDDKNCSLVYQLLSETAKEYGSGLVIVTHDQRLKDKIQTQIHL